MKTLFTIFVSVFMTPPPSITASRGACHIAYAGTTVIEIKFASTQYKIDSKMIRIENGIVYFPNGKSIPTSKNYENAMATVGKEFDVLVLASGE